jgi:hypothetical protein
MLIAFEIVSCTESPSRANKYYHPDGFIHLCLDERFHQVPLYGGCHPIESVWLIEPDPGDAGFFECDFKSSECSCLHSGYPDTFV